MKSARTRGRGRGGGGGEALDVEAQLLGVPPPVADVCPDCGQPLINHGAGRHR